MPNELREKIQEAFAEVYTIEALAKLYADIQVELQIQLEHTSKQIKKEMGER